MAGPLPLPPSPPPALAARPTQLALGLLAPPLPPAQPKGRGRPMGAPEVAKEETAKGTAPSLPAAAVGVGATQTLRARWKGGALPPSHSPGTVGLAHSTPIILWCPGTSLPDFAHAVPPPGRSPPSPAILTHVLHRLNSTWILRLSSRVFSPRKPSLMPPPNFRGSHSGLLGSSGLHNSTRTAIPR